MSPRSLILSAACLCVASTAFAAPGESSFTPTSLLVPLASVRLLGPGNGGADLYTCANNGSGDPNAALDLDDAGVPVMPEDSCLVDMADNAALAALFNHTIDIHPGTYDTVNVSLCVAPGATGYASYVKGSVELNGTTYYTASGTQVLTTHAEQQGYVRVEYAGCASGVPLPAPVTVADGDEVSINAFFTLKNIAWAQLSGNGPGGCTLNAANTLKVCTSYPIPVTYVGATSPALNTLYVTEDQLDLSGAKAGGQMLLLRDTAGHVFGGFSRRLYSESSVQPSVNYDTAIKTVEDNAPNPGYRITTFGGGSQEVPIEFYIRFPAFVPMTHDGELERANDPSPVPYRAVLQTD
jgi:hypothetical protein